MAMPVSSKSNHQVFRSDHCSSYFDRHGKWINGFPCPKTGMDSLFCCGTVNYKYCCSKKDEIRRPLSDLTLLLGAMLGIIVVVSLLTTVSCLYCQCCILYRRRRTKVHGGPNYRLHCSNSAGMSTSASGGVANMYSFSTQNSAATTPLDTSVPAIISRDFSQDLPAKSDHILVDVECEIVPPPHSFRQPTPPPPQQQQPPDITADITPALSCSPETEAADASPSTTTPSVAVSETPSQVSFANSHQRNLSTSTTGAAHVTNGSETNSGQSTSFRSSHDSGYSVTSDANDSSTVVNSPTTTTISENLYRSTKF